MLVKALIYLIEIVCDFLTGALLIRFFLQWARAAQRNPLSDFVNALTNFAVLPARRVIPGLRGLDIATLLLAWLVQLAEMFLVVHLKGYSFGGEPAQAVLALLLLSALMVVRIGIWIIIAAVIVQVIISWVNPYSPMAPTVNAVTRPFLQPFQRVIPPVANIDLSPLVLIVVCQLALMFLAYLQETLLRLI